MVGSFLARFSRERRSTSTNVVAAKSLAGDKTKKNFNEQKCQIDADKNHPLDILPNTKGEATPETKDHPEEMEIDHPRLSELSSKLSQAESLAVKLEVDLREVVDLKSIMEIELETVRDENHRLRNAAHNLISEKWRLSTQEQEETQRRLSTTLAYVQQGQIKNSTSYIELQEELLRVHQLLDQERSRTDKMLSDWQKSKNNDLLQYNQTVVQNVLNESYVTEGIKPELNVSKCDQAQLLEEQQQNSEKASINPILCEAKNNTRSFEELSIKLRESETRLYEEILKNYEMKNKIQKLNDQLDIIPILKAQIEVYRSDFDAERSAREELAGRKIDLEEEIRVLKQRLKNGLTNDTYENQKKDFASNDNHDLNHSVNVLHEIIPKISVDQTRKEPPNGIANNIDQKTHHKKLIYNGHNVAAKLSNHDFQGSPGAVEGQNISFDFSCPRCNKSFAEFEPLQVHVNTCLDNGIEKTSHI